MDLNPAFTFGSFVVGRSNRPAVAAAHAVAEAPGVAYNPLFLYGPPGQGKTHLLMALAHLARERLPSLAVRYMTLAEFAEAFETALAAGQHDAFNRRLGELDLLLLDDVHLMPPPGELQDELCRLQDRLWQTGKQLVLTCDRPPAELIDVDERLVGRFGSGLVVDIGPPDDAMRLAILRRSAKTLDASFADGVLEAVATHPVRSVRDLLSGLARLVALQAVGAPPLTPADAQRVFDAQPPADAGEPVGDSLAEGEPPDGEFEEFVAAVRRQVAELTRGWRSVPSATDHAAIGRVRSPEKTIWTWSVAPDRLIEELF